MARLTSPSGALVDVADDKVDGLLRRGFTRAAVKAEAKAEPAKKAAPKKSSK